MRWESLENPLKNEVAIVTLQVNSVEATMALLEKSSEGRVTAATAMNKVTVTSDHHYLFIDLNLNLGMCLVVGGF